MMLARSTRSVGGALLAAVMAAVFSGRAYGQDRVVVFATEGAGVSKAIPNWGLDTAWYDENNVRRGAIFMGADQVDVVRISFTPTAALVDGDLQEKELGILNNRLAWVEKWTKPSTGVCINEDSPTVDPWFKDANGHIDPARWAKLIEVTTRRAQESGRTVVAVGPFNEPDLHRPERLASKRTFYDVAGELLAMPRFRNGRIRITGGNTCNNDAAEVWYNFLWTRLDEGNTHQLAGSFDTYASFLTHVAANGDLPTNDELHNVMECIVGAEYGMQTAIWWYTAERARGEFVRASDGVRLGYAENRPNWSAAAVYRAPDGSVKAFVGESERQSVAGSFCFVSKDRSVFYDGHGPQRAYTLRTTGDSTYGSPSHRNAETVVNVTWGEDVQPVVDGRYVIVNRKSRKVLTVPGGGRGNGVLLAQDTYSGELHQQWDVNPVPYTSGGDYSYFTIRAAHSGVTADLDSAHAYEDGCPIQQWDGKANVFEQFYLEYVEDGWFKIRTRWCGKVVGVAGAHIQQGEDTGVPDQQWRFVPVGAAPGDFTAPAAPVDLTATANALSVQLSWKACPEVDLGGYTVMRSTTPGGPYEIIARDLASTTFRDGAATKPIPYHYVVKAVDRSLNGSANSAEARATPKGGESLVLHYGFEGNAEDATANGNDGVLSGPATYAPDGRRKSCLVLDGAGNYVRLPAEAGSFDQLTIAAWVCWSGGDKWQRIFDFGNGTSEYLFLTPNSGAGEMCFAIKNGDKGGEQKLRAPALPVGQWTHVAVTLGDRVATLYVNGTSVASMDSLDIRPSDFGPVLNYIGKSQWPDPLFRGKIDEFRIYNYALTAKGVAALARGNTSRRRTE